MQGITNKKLVNQTLKSDARSEKFVILGLYSIILHDRYIIFTYTYMKICHNRYIINIYIYILFNTYIEKYLLILS